MWPLCWTTGTENIYTSTRVCDSLRGADAGAPQQVYTCGPCAGKWAPNIYAVTPAVHPSRSLRWRGADNHPGTPAVHPSRSLRWRGAGNNLTCVCVCVYHPGEVHGGFWRVAPGQRSTASSSPDGGGFRLALEGVEPRGNPQSLVMRTRARRGVESFSVVRGYDTQLCVRSFDLNNYSSAEGKTRSCLLAMIKYSICTTLCRRGATTLPNTAVNQPLRSS